MRRLTLIMLAGVVAGCASDTGIIVAVSGPSVDELEFNIAVHRNGFFEIEKSISGLRYGVTGRRLTADPYEHLLQEEDASGAPGMVRVLVVGRVKGKDTYIAITDPPQTFIRDEVVRRSVSLLTLGDNASLSRIPSGCLRVWWRSGDKSNTRVLAVKGDKDCDGTSPPKDCNDDDSAVHPTAKEICDGKDNNCDGKFAPSSQICYAEDTGEVCRQGTRACGDAGGGGWAKACAVSEGKPQMPASYCDAYAACKSHSDPLSCTDKELGQAITMSCTVEKNAGTGKLCGGSYRIKSATPISKCTWTVVSDGGYELGLSDGTAEPKQTISKCEPTLVIRADSDPGSSNAVLEVKADEGSAVVEVKIKPTEVTDCGLEPLKCTVSQP